MSYDKAEKLFEKCQLIHYQRGSLYYFFLFNILNKKNEIEKKSYVFVRKTNDEMHEIIA